MELTTAQVQQEIRAGEKLSSNVKAYFFAEEAWTPNLAFKVGHKVRDIKKIARKLFVDQDIISILHTIGDFNKEDLEDLLKM